jgi:hypothetical protein
VTSDPEQLDEELYQLYKKEDFVLASDEKRNILVNRIAGEVQENLSSFLKEICYFKIDEVVKTTVERLLLSTHPSGLTDAQATRPLLTMGKTQSGKSAYIAVQIAVCSFMNVRVILVTTSKSESIDLCNKLVKYSAGGIGEHNIFSLYPDDTEEAGMTELDILYHFINFDDGGGGVLIIPSTRLKIEAATRVIENYKRVENYKRKSKNHKRASKFALSKFALIEDECDYMHRSKHGTLQMEQALKVLRSLRPSLHVMVTATPAAVLLLYTKEYGIDLDVFSIGTSEDYVGLDQMVPLRDAENVPVYLDRLSYNASDNIRFDVTATYDKELSESLFEDDNSERRFYSDTTPNSTIPCTNEKVKLLYDDALSTLDKGATGILVLDCTLPRVFADGNMFQKAGRVQDMYHTQGSPIVVIVNVGGGVFYRFPGQKYGFHCSSKRKIGDVIKMIDDPDNFGLDTPVFAFGYQKMGRAISYRSELRVPTHIGCYLGDGFPVDQVIQVLGRATFNGKKILEKNGHEAVVYLTRKFDAYVAPKHDECMEIIQQRSNDGETLDEILSGTKSKLPDSANYLCHTPRRIGQLPKKDNIGRHFDTKSFEARCD